MRLFASRKERLILGPSQLCHGHIINSSPNHVKWYDLPTHLIRLYQFLRWHKNYDDTHSMYYVGTAFGRFDEPHVFEVTVPRAKFTPLSEILSKDKTFNVYAYAHAIPTKSALRLMLGVCDEIEGTWYDIPQLLDFMIQHILGYEPDEWIKWLDAGEKYLVCSVGVMTILMAWYLAILIHAGKPRPGGTAHVERCDPATFPNHDSFAWIGTLANPIT